MKVRGSSAREILGTRLKVDYHGIKAIQAGESFVDSREEIRDNGRASQGVCLAS